MKTIILMIFFTLITACSSTQYYLLPVKAPVTTTPETDTIYALRHITLPDYLTERYILFFNKDGSINRDPKRRWANYPDDNIKRFLDLQLRTRLNANEFYQYPLPQNIHPERIIDIQIIEMIGDNRDNIFHTHATWQISDTENHLHITNQFQQNYPLPLNDGTTLSQLYETALNDLSQKIASSLTKMQ